MTININHTSPLNIPVYYEGFSGYSVWYSTSRTTYMQGLTGDWSVTGRSYDYVTGVTSAVFTGNISSNDIQFYNDSSNVSLKMAAGNDVVQFDANLTGTNSIDLGDAGITGQDSLYVVGSMSGTAITGYKGKQSVRVEGNLSGTANLGSGLDDLIAGSISNSTIEMSGDADSLISYGMISDSTISMGSGNDVFRSDGGIVGGSITGGWGNDVFVFDTLSGVIVSGDQGADTFTLNGSMSNSTISFGVDSSLDTFNFYGLGSLLSGSFTNVGTGDRLIDLSDSGKTYTFNGSTGFQNGSTVIPLTLVPPPPTFRVILKNDFDNRPVGPYTRSMVREDWNNPKWMQGIDEGRAKIVSGSSAYSGNALEVAFPKGKILNDTGVQWETYLGGSYNEVLLSYYVKFAENFSFNLERNGGKVLGLAGGDDVGGGSPATGYNGWSSRLVWNTNGIVRQYVYHVDQPTNFGDSTTYKGVNYKPGTWHKIDTRIVMNTPGQNNGIIQGSFDGVLAMDRRDYNFRETDAFAIDQLFFKTFAGGNTLDWAPLEDTSISFDELVVRVVDPISGLPPTPGPAILKYEAESLDAITGFRVETVSAASNASVLSFVGGSTNESGKAELNFGDSPAETSGSYQVSVLYFDESDGIGEIRLSHYDAETSTTNSIGSFKMDKSTVSGTPTSSNLLTYQVPGSVFLTSGDKVLVEGFENLSEHVRIDQLILSGVSSLA